MNHGTWSIYKGDGKTCRPSEICGICEKTGATRAWPHDLGKNVHAMCYQKIFRIEAELQAFLHKYCNEPTLCDEAHGIVVTAVRRECKGDTLEEYMQGKGYDALKALFLNDGKIAASYFLNSRGYDVILTNDFAV
jgi:hypothetical protein